MGRNLLSVALHRLNNQGSLIITWPGCPFHPVLFFLCAYLRGLFLRVHLLTMEASTKTFEIYILFAGFKRENADEPGKGGGSELKSFFECAYCRNVLDDVLLWTLTAGQEVKEAAFGVGGKSVAKSHEDLWVALARKYKTLGAELGTVVTTKKEVKKGKDKPKEKKEKKEKPKPKPVEVKKEKPKEVDDQAEKDAAAKAAANAEAARAAAEAAAAAKAAAD